MSPGSKRDLRGVGEGEGTSTSTVEDAPGHRFEFSGAGRSPPTDRPEPHLEILIESIDTNVIDIDAWTEGVEGRANGWGRSSNGQAKDPVMVNRIGKPGVWMYQETAQSTRGTRC